MKKKRVQNRKLLTRAEMWKAITSKYPSLKHFTTEPIYKAYRTYVHRKTMWKLIFEMKLNKSRYFTKKQKMKIEYELNLNIMEKL